MKEQMLSVIIVGDHDGFRLSAKRLLEAKGYAVIAKAADGASALEKHATGILSKLGVPLAPADHRRVLAVLKFLGHSRRCVLPYRQARNGFAACPSRARGCPGFAC